MQFPVEVYWNITRKCWSVKQKGRLLYWTNEPFTLKDCKFVVRSGGRDRVRREKRKNQHAFVKGYFFTKTESYPADKEVIVIYNPYKYDSFMEVIDHLGDKPFVVSPIKEAAFVSFVHKKVIACKK